MILFENIKKLAFAPPNGFNWICTGNDSKPLALCAARSHIVAVR
jgi:hypothetical protein